MKRKQRQIEKPLICCEEEKRKNLAEGREAIMSPARRT